MLPFLKDVLLVQTLMLFKLSFLIELLFDVSALEAANKAQLEVKVNLITCQSSTLQMLDSIKGTSSATPTTAKGNLTSQSLLEPSVRGLLYYFQIS